MPPSHRFSIVLCSTFFACLGVSNSARADEASALAAFKAAGFKPQVTEGKVVSFGWGNPQWSSELWQRLPELTNLTGLIAEGKCTDDAGLEMLTKLPKLEKLFINASTFDDAGFAILARVPNIKSIGFDHNHTFTGTGIAALKAAPHLRSFGLGGCMKFTPEGAKACAELTQLETLKLHHLGLGDDTLAALTTLIHLKELELDNSFRGTLSGEGIAQVAKLKDLEKLSLGEFITTYDGGLKHLATLSGLKTLNLPKVGLSAEDLAKLQAALPAVKITHTPPSDKELEDYQKRQEKLKKAKA